MKRNIVLTVGGVAFSAVELSPYSYQFFPKASPSVTDESGRAYALTKGKGKFYAYFRDAGKVEWFATTADSDRELRAGKPFSVAVTEVAATTAATAEKPAKPAKAKAKTARPKAVDIGAGPDAGDYEPQNEPAAAEAE
jgi:hypothetical protein